MNCEIVVQWKGVRSGKRPTQATAMVVLSAHSPHAASLEPWMDVP